MTPVVLGRTIRESQSTSHSSGLWGRGPHIRGSTPRLPPQVGRAWEAQFWQKNLETLGLETSMGAVGTVSGLAVPSIRACSEQLESWAPETSKAHLPWMLPATLQLICEQTSAAHTRPGWAVGIWCDNVVHLGGKRTTRSVGDYHWASKNGVNVVSEAYNLVSNKRVALEVGCLCRTPFMKLLQS